MHLCRGPAPRKLAFPGSPAIAFSIDCDLAAGLRRRDAKGSFLPGLGWSHRFVICIPLISGRCTRTHSPRRDAPTAAEYFVHMRQQISPPGPLSMGTRPSGQQGTLRTLL